MMGLVIPLFFSCLLLCHSGAGFWSSVGSRLSAVGCRLSLSGFWSPSASHSIRAAARVMPPERPTPRAIGCQRRRRSLGLSTHARHRLLCSQVDAALFSSHPFAIDCPGGALGCRSPLQLSDRLADKPDSLCSGC